MAREQEYIFPRLSNQKFNVYVKELAHFAKVTKPCSAHIARHTFGSLLAAKYNDPYLIMSLMGHRDIKTSMVYIHLRKGEIRRKLRDRG